MHACLHSPTKPSSARTFGFPDIGIPAAPAVLPPPQDMEEIIEDKLMDSFERFLPSNELQPPAALETLSGLLKCCTSVRLRGGGPGGMMAGALPSLLMVRPGGLLGQVLGTLRRVPTEQGQVHLRFKRLPARSILYGHQAEAARLLSPSSSAMHLPSHQPQSPLGLHCLPSLPPCSCSSFWRSVRPGCGTLAPAWQP